MLKIENLTKTFGTDPSSDNRITALRNLSLSVAEGDFVTVIGSNGSGKSTLINMICGVYQPDEGRIILDGIDITKEKEYQRARYLGRVFQDPSMGTAWNMSVLENLELAQRRGQRRKLRWGFRKENKEKFISVLKSLDLGIEEFPERKAGLLSGGQRQALTLVMATLTRPKLLLLDEHTAALDPKTAKAVLELTERTVNENKLTTMMITHNMRDALRYGNRLIMLDRGSVILDIAGKEKAKLTVSDLIKKFGTQPSPPVFDDGLLLVKEK